MNKPLSEEEILGVERFILADIKEHPEQWAFDTHRGEPVSTNRINHRKESISLEYIPSRVGGG